MWLKGMYDQVQPVLIGVKNKGAYRSLGYNIGYVCVPFQVCRNISAQDFCRRYSASSWLFTKIGSSFGRSFANKMIISLQLDWLSFVSFFIHQLFIALTRDCIFPCSPLLITSETLVSSTNFHLRSWSVTRSFIMIRKSMGPSTVPWATPSHRRTGRKKLGGAEEICPTFSDCARVVKKNFPDKLSKIFVGGGGGRVITKNSY